MFSFLIKACRGALPTKRYSSICSLQSTTKRYQLKEMSPAEANLKNRRDLAACFRILARMGLNEGICNHLSLHTVSADGKHDDLFLMIPYGVHWSQIKASQLVGINSKAEVVEAADSSATVELSARTLHAPIQSLCPQARCAIHTHMPYSTTLAALKGRVFPMVHQNCGRFVDNMVYDDEFCGVIESSNEGERLARLLGTDKQVMIMKNHGSLVVGRTVDEAFDSTYYLEAAARVICQALWTGRELEEMSPPVVAEVSRSCQEFQEEYSRAFFRAEYRVQQALTPDFED